MKRLLAVAAALLLLAAGIAWAKPAQNLLSVSGAVKQPLRLSLDQLASMRQVRVKHNDISTGNRYRGIFWLEGVPLRDVLDLAVVQKEAGGIPKAIDLAIVVKSADGRQVALSWGEVYHRNPSEIVLATSARPVMPHKKCQACHKPAEYRPWMNQLERKVGLPKLVVTGDFYADRSLENVTSITVRQLGKTFWGPKQKRLYSPSLTVEGPGVAPRTITGLPALPRFTEHAIQAGEGKGYHGSFDCTGVALTDLLAHFKVPGGLNTVYLIKAPDGYRSLASWGELFLRPGGRRVLLADRINGKPIDDGGKFELVFPDDLYADRWVKAASDIRAVSLAPAKKGRLTVIGVGCGDSKLLTLKALAAIDAADALVVPKDIQKRFAFYLQGKPVLFDPMAAARRPFNKKGLHGDQKARQRRGEEQKAAADAIRAQLKRGVNVALLDWGDPMVYGSWRWLGDFFAKDEISFVPGLSAFNAGSAALARDITCQGAVAISDPFTIMNKPEMVKALAARGATLVVFMGMPKFKTVMAAVARAYPPDTPVGLVLRAGFSDGQKVLRGTLGNLNAITANLGEKWLGIIFVGPCLGK